MSPVEERFGLRLVRVRGFRTATDVTLRPGNLCALVGEANAGKSNLLGAIRALLDTKATLLGKDDASSSGDGRIRIEGRLGGVGGSLLVTWPPSRGHRPAVLPSTLFLPADIRAAAVLAPAAGREGTAARAADLLTTTITELTASHDPPSATSGANALVRAIERCCDSRLSGVIVLIEEPELYLRPQAQRYLYRLLHSFASAGNQVVYSTHAPAFLNVARLDELAVVERTRETGTKVLQPEPLPADDQFRALSEVDAERGELLLSRTAVLVEGRTEKLALPFLFRARGHDPDREGISIVDCGGKSNIPLFARICRAVGLPFIAVHDRDAPRGRQPIDSERRMNALIAEITGRERTIVLEPDFEGVAGFRSHDHKPEQAWRRFGAMGASDVPAALGRVVNLTLSLVRD